MNASRTPTPAMIAAAWNVIDAEKKASGIAKLGAGLGVREIWEAMWDAAIRIEAGTGGTPKSGPTRSARAGAEGIAQRHD